MIDLVLRSDKVEYFVCLSTEQRTKTSLRLEYNTGHLAREGVSGTIVRPETYSLNRTWRQYLGKLGVQSRWRFSKALIKYSLGCWGIENDIAVDESVQYTDQMYKISSRLYKTKQDQLPHSALDRWTTIRPGQGFNSSGDCRTQAELIFIYSFAINILTPGLGFQRSHKQQWYLVHLVLKVAISFVKLLLACWEEMPNTSA